MKNLNKQPKKLEKDFKNGVGESICNLWCSRSFKRLKIKTFPPMYLFTRERKSCSNAMAASWAGDIGDAIFPGSQHMSVHSNRHRKYLGVAAA
jgi:hypothetical protein